MGTLLFSHGALSLLAVSVLLLPGDDPWASGGSLKEWQRVTELQRYPLYQEKAPDLKTACKDPSPIVRAAAALAVGRAGDAALLPALVPLLEDEWPLTRRCALWALTQIQGPSIKEPLLKVLGSWPHEDFNAYFPGQHLSSLLPRVGLPADLLNMDLPVRKAWLKEFDAKAWTATFRRTPHIPFTGDDGGGSIVHCPATAEVDAGEPFSLRVRVVRSGGKETLTLNLDSNSIGKWSAIDGHGRLSNPDLYHHRLPLPALNMKLEPNGAAVADVAIAQKGNPVPPGIYLFHAYNSQAPILMRVRRNAASDRQLAELLKTKDVKAVRKLGEERVRSAVPALIELFRANADDRSGLRWAAAEALGRIGDPAAVPALLEQPSLVNVDVLGDTSRALREIGPAAYPIYEANIRNWKTLLAGEKHQILSMSLHLRGADVSGDVDRVSLELLEHLVKENVDYAKAQHYGPLKVFQAVVAAIGPRHPEKAADAIWATRTRPATFAALVQNFYPRASPAAGPILSDLWRRRQRDPAPQGEVRAALARQIQYFNPELLLTELSPIASLEEAHVVAGWARSHTDKASPAIQRKTVERVQAFLKKSPDPGLQIALARLLYDLKEYEQCEALADQALGKLDQPLRRSEAHYWRGQARIARDNVAEGTKDLRTALELLPPNHGYDGIHDATIRRDLAKAAERVTAPGLKWRQHYMKQVSISKELEIAGGRAIYVDDLRRLCWWDPIAEDGGAFAPMPNDVKDFMPLERGRVFVAFLDGTAALYQQAKEAPVWNRSLPLGFSTYLSASPRVITAADDKGVLHALDPATGKTLWTRNVPGRPWPERWGQSFRSIIHQHGDRVLIPDRVDAAKSIECVQISTGKTLWTHPCMFGVDKLAVSDELLVVAGRDGDVAAVSMADGKLRWHKRVEGKASYPYFGLTVTFAHDHKTVYLALTNVIRALSADSGEAKWTWRWTPLQGKPSPMRDPGILLLCPAERALYVLVNWTTEGEAPERVDVLVLTPEGKPRFQRTAPPTRYYADDPYVQNSVFVFRRGAYWDVWDFSKLKEER